MVKWYTRHADMTQATTTYSGLTLDTRNNTVSAPKIASGYQHIKYIVAVLGIDAALTTDVGVIGVLKLSGDAMYHGDQEMIVGFISEQETGTSVTDLHRYKPAYVMPTNIWLKDGQTLDLSAAYFGTDIGSPIMSVSLGVERGRGGTPLQYRTRGDSHTDATDAYGAIETKPDGTTGAFDVPTGVRFIPRMFTNVVLNLDADTLIGGNTFTYEFSGDALGSTAQEIVGYGVMADEGGGTVTATDAQWGNPAVLPVELGVTGGNSLSLAAAFKGTDLGTTFVAATLELVGGQGVA